MTFVGESPGRQQITGTLDVNKIRGGVTSGPISGAVFNAFSFVATYVALRFNSDGTYSIKVGSGGSYSVIGQWAGARGAQNEDFWLRVEASGHALDSGTEDTWLALTSAREYVLSDAASGTHRTDLRVFFAQDNIGTGAVGAFGALELIVP